MKIMLLIFEDGDEEAFLKVQGLAQSASRIEPLEFRSQRSTSALEIRENQRRVFCKGREIPLTKTEYEIPLYLFQNINQVLTHDQIYEKIWKEPSYGEARKMCIRDSPNRIHKFFGAYFSRNVLSISSRIYYSLFRGNYNYSK